MGQAGRGGQVSTSRCQCTKNLLRSPPRQTNPQTNIQEKSHRPAQPSPAQPSTAPPRPIAVQPQPTSMYRSSRRLLPPSGPQAKRYWSRALARSYLQAGQAGRPGRQAASEVSRQQGKQAGPRAFLRATLCFRLAACQHSILSQSLFPTRPPRPNPHHPTHQPVFEGLPEQHPATDSPSPPCIPYTPPVSTL